MELFNNLFQSTTTVIIEIIILGIFVIWGYRLEKLLSKIKRSFEGMFNIKDIRKDTEIKRTCQYLTDIIHCSNTMVIRLHNGESASSYYHFKKATAIFDEPRPGAELLIDQWQNVSYGIFANQVEKVLNEELVSHFIEDIHDDNSYKTFHLNKGIYFQIMVPLWVGTKNDKKPFGYLIANFNREKAFYLRDHPEHVQTYIKEINKAKDLITGTLNLKKIQKKLPEA